MIVQPTAEQVRRVARSRTYSGPGFGPRSFECIGLGLGLGIGLTAGAKSVPVPVSLFGANLLQYVCLLPGASAVTLDTNTTTTLAGLSDLGVVPRNFSQATKAKQPTYTASDATLNNKPTATTDGTDDELTSTLTLPAPGTTPFVIFGVIKATLGTNKFFYADNGSNGGAGSIFSTNASNFGSQCGNAAVTSAGTSGVWVRFYAEYSNNAADVFKVGSNANSTGNAGAGSGAVGRAIGSAGGAAYGSFSFAELGVATIARGTFPLTAYSAWVTSNWPATQV